MKYRPGYPPDKLRRAVALRCASGLPISKMPRFSLINTMPKKELRWFMSAHSLSGPRVRALAETLWIAPIAHPRNSIAT